LLSQYCKSSHFLVVANFYVWGAPTVRFAPVVPWAKTGPGDSESVLSWLRYCDTTLILLPKVQTTAGNGQMPSPHQSHLVL
jgi:hypothetical protein